MNIRKISAIVIYLLLLALFLQQVSTSKWPTLLLLAAVAWLSLDSLLGVSILGSYYQRLSASVYGAFHRQITWLTVALCAALAVVLAVY